MIGAARFAFLRTGADWLGKTFFGVAVRTRSKNSSAKHSRIQIAASSAAIGTRQSLITLAAAVTAKSISQNFVAFSLLVLPNILSIALK